MTRLRQILAVAMLALGALGLFACGDDDDDTAAPPKLVGNPGSFVGTVKGTNAYIALVSNGEASVGYVCDGKRISTWLTRQPVHGGRLALVDRQGKRLGQASLADGALGEITLAGSERSFAVERAEGRPAPSDSRRAGLYRAEKGTAGKPGYEETGWIVLHDGSVRGCTNYIDPTTGQEGSKPAASARPSADSYLLVQRNI